MHRIGDAVVLTIGSGQRRYAVWTRAEVSAPYGAYPRRKE